MSKRIKPGETVGKPIQSSDVELTAPKNPFDGIFGSPLPEDDSRADLGYRKGAILRNIVWATWRSWDGTHRTEQNRAQSWLDAQRAELLKWRERWAVKVDTDRILREVFPQVSARSNQFEVAARDFVGKVLGF